MTTRMLIDARHREETRVAVLKGNRIEEFDFESAEHKQIKGNIYLAKVTRVEPSLQAAFVDFGGNRHGFLAFAEIHPDYYQIPKEDREALLAEEAAHAEEEAALRALEEAEEDGAGEYGESFDDDHHDDDDDHHGADLSSDHDDTDHDDTDHDDTGHGEDEDDDNGDADDASDADADSEGEAKAEGDAEPDNAGRGRRGRPRRARAKGSDEMRAKRMALRRRYKIQDVIHRRQVLLVQVVKEERGNKGAALTTYLSLAGRYCVLMPNSSHGGGISRKISSAADRKRLKTIIAEMDLPKSMGCIVRTAGLSRTKPEIKRDFDYLARLWDEIRERTLGSSAPAGIHSDSDLVKRAIRDIYSREVEEVIVEGEGGYKAARDFMKLLMPSHARRVKQYADPVPLFQRYGAEDQLSAMYDPVVQLKSGGYLVINPTEALVSIDINSGRSTKEHGIEATALSTNLEAAREIARQLRLRDMAGLVVIDFIDMEYSNNTRKVEKAMKDALKNDRARIQVGRISSFGLMEMSRQRLRTGVLEATTRSCPHCDGSGLVRTASSAGLSALRLIEDEAAKGRGSIISLYASTEAAVYLLNAKRADLAEIEALYGVRVEVLPEGENEGAKMRVGSSGPPPAYRPRFEPIIVEEDDSDLELDEDFDDENEAEEAAERNERGDRKRSRGRRRRKNGRRDENGSAEAGEAGEADETGEASSDETADGEDGDRPKKRRRSRNRRRRGGDRPDGANGETGNGEANETSGPSPQDDLIEAASEATAEIPAHAGGNAAPAPVKPKTRRASSRKKPEVEAEAEVVKAEVPAEEPPAQEAPAQETPAKPKRASRAKKAAVVEEAPAAELEVAAVAEDAKPKRASRAKKAAPADGAEKAATSASDNGDGQNADGSPRRGWWQRTFG